MLLLQSLTLLFSIIVINSFNYKEDINDSTKPAKKQKVYESKIAGGEFAYIKDFPYVAFLFPTRCGATIIGKRWLLTIWDCNAPVLTALVGVDTIKNRYSGDHKIILSYRHKKKNWDKEELFPIILLKLEKALLFTDRIQPVAIGSEEHIYDGNLASIAGFGATEFDKGILTNENLRSVKIPIATHETCIRTFPTFRSYLSGNRDRDFCSGFNADFSELGGKHSFCKADLGSGLVTGNGKERRLVGIAIHTQGCGIWNDPGIYASVPFAISFLARLDPEHDMDLPDAIL